MMKRIYLLIVALSLMATSCTLFEGEGVFGKGEIYLNEINTDAK